MKDYIANNWRACLEFNGLTSFEDFWDLDADWVEPVNSRRGGWSGVARGKVRRSDGGEAVIFIKRQENHFKRTLRHPVRGVLTFEREFRSILRYRERQIPSLIPIYFARRMDHGRQRAVLITEELDGFQSLQDLARGWHELTPPPRRQRLALIDAVADTLRLLHRHHLRHNCFYPKHILVRFTDPEKPEIRLIDLEKTIWVPFLLWSRSRDLRNLASGSCGWSNTDRMRFFKRYLNVGRIGGSQKAAWQQIRRQVVPKMSRRAARRAARNSIGEVSSSRAHAGPS